MTNLYFKDISYGRYFENENNIKKNLHSLKIFTVNFELTY